MGWGGTIGGLVGGTVGGIVGGLPGSAAGWAGGYKYGSRFDSKPKKPKKKNGGAGRTAPRRPSLPSAADRRAVDRTQGIFQSLGGMALAGSRRAAALDDFGRGQFLSNFDRSLAERRAALQGQLAGEQGWLARERAALSGRFNFGEDPRARAARDAALATLNRQRDEAGRSIDQSYGAGINATRQAAADALALGKRSGEELGGIYSSAANAVASSNNQLAQQAQVGAGFLGVQGPVGGEAVDVGAALAAAAPREQALAQTLGQSAADMQNYFASSMANQQGAEQGSMRRAVTAMQDQVNRDFMEREAARIQAEREAYRAAEAELASRAQDRRSAIQQALADLAGAGSQARAEWAMRDADRRYERGLTREERNFALGQADAVRRDNRNASRADLLVQMRALGFSDAKIRRTLREMGY